ncbi:hypothetical protein SKAU_G00140980 [Synaphobranchus kaupii]|uniref:Uncharacterized protein n=1 Tax=Synaphobranchus kaupii TaxID=118154 RepID=A0A9Q1J253_SYNKA|nr:hypothetical protein SKAU_G00140980 [Synaphobranchus kaupii]
MAAGGRFPLISFARSTHHTDRIWENGPAHKTHGPSQSSRDPASRYASQPCNLIQGRLPAGQGEGAPVSDAPSLGASLALACVTGPQPLAHAASMRSALITDGARLGQIVTGSHLRVRAAGRPGGVNHDEYKEPQELGPPHQAVQCAHLHVSTIASSKSALTLRPLPSPSP